MTFEFLGPDVSHVGPLKGPLTMDLKTTFFQPKLGRTTIYLADDDAVFEKYQ